MRVEFASMDVKFLEENQYQVWEDFVKKSGASIWQSAHFGSFQLKVPGRSKRWILGVFKNDELIGGMQFFRFDLPGGMCWLYGARGPVVPGMDAGVIHLLMQEIEILARKENAVFLRLDPAVEKFLKLGKEIKEGFQPQTTLCLDLQQSEEELLAQMKQKGRYNIKVAGKNEVEVVEGGEEDMKDYGRLLRETTARDGFKGHKLGFYKKMLAELEPQGMAKLFLAKHEGKVLAAAICTYFGETATYYYGVSSNKNRNVMAPYILQWKMIQDARARGFKVYDFLGISPSDSAGHKWDGVTSFKKKFGGEVVDYCRPQEVVYKKLLYLLYALRRKMRG